VGFEKPALVVVLDPSDVPQRLIHSVAHVVEPAEQPPANPRAGPSITFRRVACTQPLRTSSSPLFVILYSPREGFGYGSM
jgi:hypothetical protein